MSETIRGEPSVPKSPSRDNGSAKLSSSHNLSTEGGKIPPSPSRVDEESHYPYPPNLGPSPARPSPAARVSTDPALGHRKPSEAPAKTPGEVGTGRRGKAHTSNACNNCKRAHLGCDSKRPCGRCLAMGKQVSRTQYTAGEAWTPCKQLI